MNKFISLLLSLTLLFGLVGCNAESAVQSVPASQTQSQSATMEIDQREEQASSAPSSQSEEKDEFDVNDTAAQSQDFSKYEEVKKDKYLTTAVPSGHQQPVEPGEVEIDRNNQKTCYLTISCETILDNMEDLAQGKEVLVPSDGMILPRTEVAFFAGESVFDVLQRETQSRKIHMESNFTPMYNSAYIEGIANLYEFDCGSESGWEYSVNDWFPNYGVSRYAVQQGDEIKLLYTCDLGRDLGAA